MKLLWSSNCCHTLSTGGRTQAGTGLQPCFSASEDKEPRLVLLRQAPSSWCVPGTDQGESAWQLVDSLCAGHWQGHASSIGRAGRRGEPASSWESAPASVCSFPWQRGLCTGQTGVVPSNAWQLLWRQHVAVHLPNMTANQLLDALWAAAMWSHHSDNSALMPAALVTPAAPLSTTVTAAAAAAAAATSSSQLDSLPSAVTAFQGAPKSSSMSSRQQGGLPVLRRPDAVPGSSSQQHWSFFEERSQKVRAASVSGLGCRHCWSGCGHTCTCVTAACWPRACGA